MTISNYEAMLSRISLSLMSGSNPKIVGLRFSNLLDVEGKKVFAIEVPKNLSIPSMIVYNGSNSFYKRNNTDKYMPDTYELYRLFLRQHSFKDDVERFIYNRLPNVFSPFAKELEHTPLFIAHVIPFTFQDVISLPGFNTVEFKNNAEKLLLPLSEFNYKLQFGYSFDGLYFFQSPQVFHNTIETRIVRQDLFFRNGIVETLDASSFGADQNNLTNNLYVEQLAESLNKLVNRIFKYYEQLNIPSDFYLSVRMVNLFPKTYLMHRSAPISQIDQSSIELPTIMISNKEQKKEGLNLLFDILWQTFGEMSCPEDIKEKFNKD